MRLFVPNLSSKLKHHQKKPIKPWRKGWFLYPFCHLVIKAVRVDSHPGQNNTQSLGELLRKYRANTSLSQGALAEKPGVSIGTLKNWEQSWTRPNRRFWSGIRTLVNSLKVAKTTAHMLETPLW
jgi:DNA-binding XRE family transcriptional regulator